MSYRHLRHDIDSRTGLQNHDDPAHPQVVPKPESPDRLSLRSNRRDSPSGDYELDNLNPSQHSTSNLDDGEWDKEDSELSANTHAFSRRASASTVQSFMLYTPDEERSVVKKFDRRLVLFIAALYMLSFLDRSSMPICEIFIKDIHG